MGVRGTEFQAVYNPEGKTTSLVTFEGEVQLAKIKKNARAQNFKIEKSLEIVLKRNS